MLEGASSTSVHIFAERTICIVDALKERAPNADIAFFDAKVRCQLNHTLDLVASKDQKTANAFLVFY